MKVRAPVWLTKLFSVDDSVLEEQFTLLDNASQNTNPSSGNDSKNQTKGRTADKESSTAQSEQAETKNSDSPPPSNGQSAEPSAEENQRASGQGGKAAPEAKAAFLGQLRSSSVRPSSMRAFIDNAANKYEDQLQDRHPYGDDDLPVDLDTAKQRLEKIFHVPKNKDVVIREFSVGTELVWRGLIVFVDGMADKTIINEHILQPLMLLTHVTEDNPRRNMEVVAERLVPGNQITTMEKWSEVVPGILTGSTAVFLDHCNGALIVETKGWEHRTVGQAQTENVVRGPHNAFTESFRANTGLVRSLLRSEHLVTEIHEVGNLGKTDVGLMYVDGLTNPMLIDEARRRIQEIDVDYLGDSGSLEQFIEDKPSMMIPQVFSTERPDRIAAMLAEGHVAIFVGNSPYVLAVPVVLWTLVQTPEDAYLRFPYGTFLRMLRWIAITVALLLPSLYVAVTNYHPEMIPTDLMLAIAGSREQVPFPVVVEILLMEFAIELIREAGIRIPSVIGPTIGIVGALIIGQAAVQAGIVSPLLVIVVATTALAAFTIPNYNLSLAVRILRFAFLFAASILGFYGIAVLAVVYLVRLSMQKSFGVPVLAPVAPAMDSSPDVFSRGPVFMQNRRPKYLQTLQTWRQAPITRPWSSDTRPKGARLKKGKGGKQS